MNFHPETCQLSFQSPWGPMTLSASPEGLCGAWFDEQKHFPDASQWPVVMRHPILDEAKHLLTQFGKGRVPANTSAAQWLSHLPLDISRGTPFQQMVWRALMQIPLGQTCSYAQLALAIGKPSASRAVGTAVGRNPISVLIPCHRVIGSSGQMTGYAGGLWRKEALLGMEFKANGVPT